MPVLAMQAGKWVPDPEKAGALIWDGYFLPKQEEYVWTPDDGRTKDIACYLGGVGSGKTYASARKGFLIAQAFPGSRGLVGAEDYPLVRDTTLNGPGGWIDFMENELGMVEGHHFEFNRTEHKITFPNGSEVLFRGLRDANKIKSLNLLWAHIEEASDITLDAFLMVHSRLRQTRPHRYKGPWRHFLFLSTNPEEVSGWINDIFVDQTDNEEWSELKRKAVARLRQFIRYIHAPTTENDRLPEGFVEDLQALGDEDWVDVYVHGKTGGMGKGRAYKRFARTVHVDQDGSIAYYRPELPLCLALDFNVDPMTATVSHILPDRSLVTIDEISVKDATTEDLCREFVRRYHPDTGERNPHRGQVRVYGDASGTSRSTKTSESDYDVVRRMLNPIWGGTWGCYFRIPEANGAVRDRVNSVNAKLKNAMGDVAWRIHARCKVLIKDLEQVRWKEGTGELEKKKDPTLTHMSDGIGYLIVQEFPVKPPADYRKGAQTTGARISTGGGDSGYGYDS